MTPPRIGLRFTLASLLVVAVSVTGSGVALAGQNAERDTGARLAEQATDNQLDRIENFLQELDDFLETVADLLRTVRAISGEGGD